MKQHVCALQAYMQQPNAVVDCVACSISERLGALIMLYHTDLFIMDYPPSSAADINPQLFTSLK